MTNTPPLSGLIERLEKATGPDRELDEAIRVALGYPPKPWNYTSSFDAAMTLVPEPLRKLAFLQTSEPAKAGFEKDSVFTYFEGATPALALCIAALKARLATTRDGVV